MDQQQFKKYLICGGVAVVSISILILWSFDTVEPVEWGLKLSLLALPLRTRTKEGLALGLHVSFQYQLIKDELPELYAMANLEYELTFIRIARDVILQSGGLYEAPAYWSKRGIIGEEMQNELDYELRKAHARCIYLELLKIDLPHTYEKSIVNTQVEVQKKRMKKYEQSAERIRQGVKIMISETDKAIKGINAEAQATAYLVKQTAVAKAMNNTINAEINAYARVKKETGLTGLALNKYIFYLGLMQKKETLMLVGMEGGILNIQK